MIRVIDAVLEDNRLGLELSVVNQHRIKFLGELYNYQLIDAALIFRVLYLFISFGCRSDGRYSKYYYHYLIGSLHQVLLCHWIQ